MNNQLKKFRLENKLTQQVLADRIGINKTTYSDFETGARRPSLRVALKIQKVTGIPVETLFGEEFNDNE